MKPLASLVPAGSPRSSMLLSFRSIKKFAPAIGPSTTLASNASITEIEISVDVMREPSEAITVTW